ncbi:M48 family metallopeptidase [Palleronia caenipelagi]|uniref:M48 family metallopeptidase n=2 Tax=Palleronia caenipelagi TaxID=2489174 RepID=A0A547PY39_9RHOB|nr:M48 family metallopeptidase [Palleronia caenipelagi]
MVEIGTPPVMIRMRSSARARRMTLRVSRLDGGVVLTRPRGVRLAEAVRFAETKVDWLRAQLADVSPRKAVALGAEVPVGGVALPVVTGRPGIGAAEIRVRERLPAGPQVEALLKGLARERLRRAVDRHGAVLGRKPGRLTLRDTRSRWGSCTAKGDLMFSWRLVMAPEDVLDYVAAHEVAHLVHMDHSPAFWSVTEHLCPDWRSHRRWLRDHGTGLHAWMFREA